MKKVAGTLKIDQAQYRELEAFAKFGSDLDAATLSVLEKGRRNVEILKQGQFEPYTVEDQTAIIFAGTQGLLRKVPVDRVKDFEKEYLDFLKTKHANILESLSKGVYTDAEVKVLTEVAKSISSGYVQE
jgi:F-type H+-transporting ATPase subunit alpha